MTTSVSLIILGAGGDLTRRLLLPGLASLLGEHDYEVQVIGASREERTDEQWRDLIRASFADVPEHNGAPLTAAEKADAGQAVATARYFAVDVTSPDALRMLIGSCAHTPVFYFALPPAVTERVCEALRQVELPAGTRLALEKPFGTDYASAQALDLLIGRLVPEQQVFRIDHFLGMSMVLNILGLRFANRFLEPVWNAANVERVEIDYDETLGLEGRGGYYDNAGALVDMLQSHLLEVLAFIAMEQMPRLDEIELRSNAAQVLRATRVWRDDPATASKRARYTAGTIDGRTLPAYVDEPGVDPARQTETLAQLTVEVDTPRWRGVPFVLRSGKALGKNRKRVRLLLRPVSPLQGFFGAAPPDAITFDFKSGELVLLLTANGSGDPFDLEQNTLVATMDRGDMLPYGQVLRGILDGDPMLSVRGDIAEECWRIVDPVLDAWREDAVPLEDYPAGSAGPSGW